MHASSRVHGSQSILNQCSPSTQGLDDSQSTLHLSMHTCLRVHGSQSILIQCSPPSKGVDMLGRASYTYLCLALPECMALRAF